METILHIDWDLQQRNKVRKDASNNILQVTDKAQNIPFYANTGEEPIFNYGGGDCYAEFTGVNYQGIKGLNTEKIFDDLDGGDFWMEFLIYYDNTNGVNQVFCNRRTEL